MKNIKLYEEFEEVSHETAYGKAQKLFTDQYYEKFKDILAEYINNLENVEKLTPRDIQTISNFYIAGMIQKIFMSMTQLKENILPKPYKKVKCSECGEEVCDNINYKIGHLYNKHNCKPSVDDYKAKRMLKQYFPYTV